MSTVKTDLGNTKESARRERVEPTGNISQTNVQKALEALDTGKITNLTISVPGGTYSTSAMPTTGTTPTIIISNGVETANLVAAGPATGTSGVWSFRALVANDIPSLPFTNSTGTIPFKGDLTGNIANFAATATVVAIQNKAVTVTAPATGKVLVWNGSANEYEPFGLEGITGYVLVSAVSGTIPFKGDLTGNIANFAATATVVAIQNKAVTVTAPTTGQVLVWNNTANEYEPLSLPNITGTVSGGQLPSTGALAVLGRSANSGGQVAGIAATAGTGLCLCESGSAISFGRIAATTGLADYAEGSWTPALQGNTTTGTQGYTTQLGRYIRDGNIVHAFWQVQLNAKDTATSGNFGLGGLPFPVRNLAGYNPQPVLGWAFIALNTAGNFYTLSGFAQPGTSRIDFYQIGSGVNYTQLTQSSFTNTSGMVGSLTYFIN